MSTTPTVKIVWTTTHQHRELEKLLLIVKHLWGHTPNFEAHVYEDSVYATGYGFRYNRSISNALEKAKLDKAIAWTRVGLFSNEDIDSVNAVISEINGI